MRRHSTESMKANMSHADDSDAASCGSPSRDMFGQRERSSELADGDRLTESDLAELPVAATFRPNELFGGSETDTNNQYRTQPSTESTTSRSMIFPLEQPAQQQQAMHHSMASMLHLLQANTLLASGTVPNNDIAQRLQHRAAVDAFARGGVFSSYLDQSINAAQVPNRVMPAPRHDHSILGVANLPRSAASLVVPLQGEKMQVPQFTTFPHITEPTAEAFPMILHRLLTDQARTDDIIASFLDGGKSFLIFKPKRFEIDIMPKYFPRMNRLSSFHRQLNLYNFTRIRGNGTDRGAYCHDLFLRNRPDLAATMRRTKIKGMFTVPPEKRRKRKHHGADEPS